MKSITYVSYEVGVSVGALCNKKKNKNLGIFHQTFTKPALEKKMMPYLLKLAALSA